MILNITRKIKKGKLIKLRVDLSGNILLNIQVRGDFFLYPEERLEDVEKILENVEISKINERLSRFIKKENITILGFAPKDLQEVIEDEMEVDN